jgi:acyl-CoA reductase-like NAD-dependent aldehyde dehydrogenase
MSHPYQVIQAYDKALIQEIPADDAVTLGAKVEAAFRLSKDRDSALKPYQRSAILIRAAGLLGESLDAFARLIAQEGGKPVTDASIEAIRAVDGLRNAAEEIRNFAGREIPMGLTPASDGRWAFTIREPIGVVAAISAFNHPLNLIVHQVAPAIAVGCPVIVKPAVPTPLSCLELVTLLREAGLPESWCQTLVTEDNALSERLAIDPRIAFLSFMGSARVGWYLRSKLAPGTRCALEHGGAAPVLIDRSAKLDRIIEPIVMGGYYHVGQVCVSTQRIFVHNDIKAEFVARLAARVQALRVGDPLPADTEVGPLILPREATRVSSWIDEAVAAGAQLIGGGRRSETTLVPAILVEPAADAKMSQLEIFGPPTCVYGFENFDHAIEIANSLPFAFQASVFSSDIGPALRAAQRLDASAVMINDHTAFRTDWMPFAGRRQSGYGIGSIRRTMDEMSTEKMLVFRHTD